MTTTTLSVLFSLSTAVVVGSFTLFVRSGQRYANAVSGVLIGIIVSFPPLLVVAIWTWEPTHYQPLAWFFFALAGVMGPAVGRVCFFHSIHLRGVARAVPLNSTMPLFSAIIGILILGERPGVYTLAGTVFIVLGCVGITSKRGEPRSVRKEYLLVALGSVVFFSISHMLRKLGVGPAPNPFVGISIMSVSGGVSLYVFGQYLPPGLRPSLVVKKAWVAYSIGGSLNALRAGIYNQIVWVGRDALLVADTIALIAIPGLFLGVYYAFCILMRAMSGSALSTQEFARLFVLSLVPIAIGYHIAHYFSFLFIQGQRIIPLLSDPLGMGWNLWGTAAYKVDIGVIGAKTTWYASIAAIVIGHICAVYLAHVSALRALENRFAAVRSQYPMLVLMLGYTMVSLWIIAQPITGG